MSAGLAPASSDRAVGGLAAVLPVGWAEEEEPGMGRDTSSMVKTLWLRLESMLSFVAAFCRFAAPCRTRLMPATGDTGSRGQAGIWVDEHRHPIASPI